MKFAFGEGFGADIPPLLIYVKIYFIQKGRTEKEAEQFYKHYQDLHWVNENNMPVRNWKIAASGWIWEIKKVTTAFKNLKSKNE